LVADYSWLGLKGDKLKEWAYLDTFDMLAPKYDFPQTLESVQAWADKAHLTRVDVEYTPHGITVRGISPASI
jgi:hypothetical protein